MNRKYVTLGLLLVFAVALVGVPEVVAKSSYLSDFNAMYGTANTRLDTCDTCHVPGSKALNPYGTDYGNNGHNFATIEPFDSDSDTYSNIIEINARTFPGDTSDYPAPTPTPTPAPTATVTFIVTDSVSGLAIQGASVAMDGIKKKTDASGTAVFINVALGDHSYTASKTGYKRASSTVSVTADTTVSVKLVPR